MKTSEIRALSTGEKKEKLQDLTQSLFNLRFQHASSQLENVQKMKQTRRDIARIKTIMREAEQAA